MAATWEAWRKLAARWRSGDSALTALHGVAPAAPEPLLYELRMLHRDLCPNIEGVSPESTQRARARLEAIINRWGRGEFFT